jgi:hypothetical protein
VIGCAASALQRSDEPSRRQVRQAITAARIQARRDLEI